MDPGLASYHATGLRDHLADTAANQQMAAAPSALQDPAAHLESLQSSTVAAADKQKGLTDILAEQEAVQKLQQALVKSQEVSKTTIDQLRSSVVDLQDKGRAAAEHIRAVTPDLGPASAKRGLQELGQATLEQVQGAANKAHQVGQGSLDQVRSTAQGLAQQAPWRAVRRVQWQPPSWLTRLPPSTDTLATQQNALVNPSTAAATAPSHQGPEVFTERASLHPKYAAASIRAPKPAEVQPALQPDGEQTQAGIGPAAATEQHLPAFRLHSSRQPNHLATLSQPAMWTPAFAQDTASSPLAQWHHCQAVESTIVLQSAADRASQARPASLADAQLSSLAPLEARSEAASLMDRPDQQHLAGADRANTSQDSASPIASSSTRSACHALAALKLESWQCPSYRPCSHVTVRIFRHCSQ